MLVCFEPLWCKACVGNCSEHECPPPRGTLLWGLWCMFFVKILSRFRCKCMRKGVPDLETLQVLFLEAPVLAGAKREGVVLSC
mmetsp:Transcript_35761/g.90162  ORF Transcript_35761/g.90162 Transcript_35761/m.90162 type:complete len:83 (-) Transcript_35761:565-813(-)